MSNAKQNIFFWKEVEESRLWISSSRESIWEERLRNQQEMASLSLVSGEIVVPSCMFSRFWTLHKSMQMKVSPRILLEIYIHDGFCAFLLFVQQQTCFYSFASDKNKELRYCITVSRWWQRNRWSCFHGVEQHKELLLKHPGSQVLINQETILKATKDREQLIWTHRNRRHKTVSSVYSTWRWLSRTANT